MAKGDYPEDIERALDTIDLFEQKLGELIFLRAVCASIREEDPELLSRHAIKVMQETGLTGGPVVRGSDDEESLLRQLERNTREDEPNSN